MTDLEFRPTQSDSRANTLNQLLSRKKGKAYFYVVRNAGFLFRKVKLKILASGCGLSTQTHESEIFGIGLSWSRSFSCLWTFMPAPQLSGMMEDRAPVKMPIMCNMSEP